ncbi:MAG: sodium:solute symporter [Vicinamibacterales bacterium]
MTSLDVAVIVAYLLLVIAVNRRWANRVDVADWLTSRNSIGAGFLVFTVVSTNVGAGTIIGTAGSTMHAGIGLGVTYGVGVMIGFWIMAALTQRLRAVAPASDRSSFSEFFRRRYSPAVGVAVGLAIGFLYFFYLAAQFKALSGMLEVWGGWNAQAAGIGAALLVIWLTAGAGIRSDLYTDALHFWAMVVTIVAIVTIEVGRQGGVPSLVQALDARQRWSTLIDPYTFAGPAFVWLGIATGALLGLPAMENWQRIDAATDTRAARRAFLWSGLLNALFFAAAVTLGLVAAATLPADTPSNHVLFRLIQQSLPPGLLGLAVVGLFAALMSTANTMLMVAVTVLLSDLFYARHERLAAVPDLLRTTRRLTWGVGVAGLGIAFLQPQIISLIQTALWGSGMLLPALIGGLFWRRATAAAALASIAVGFPLNVILSFAPGWQDTSWMPALGAATVVFVAVSVRGRPVQVPARGETPSWL